MEQFNTIPTSGSWADIAGILDANFLRCWTALVQSESLIGLDGSNYRGIFTSADALPEMTEPGWALVGTSLSALKLYVYNEGSTDWALLNDTTYNFTNFTEFQTQLDNLSSQVATIGLKLGDLTQLETEEKTNLVDAINEVMNNASSTAQDTTYVDTHSIGATNVQTALDRTIGVQVDMEEDFYSEVSNRVVLPTSGWTGNVVVSGTEYLFVSSTSYNRYAYILPYKVKGGSTLSITTASGDTSKDIGRIYFLKGVELDADILTILKTSVSSESPNMYYGSTYSLNVPSDADVVLYYAWIPALATSKSFGDITFTSNKSIRADLGDVTDLTTHDKSSVVGAINELAAEVGSFESALEMPSDITMSAGTWVDGLMLASGDYMFTTTTVAANKRCAYIIPYYVNGGTTFKITTGSGSTATDIGRAYFLKDMGLENTTENMLSIPHSSIIGQSDNFYLGSTYSMEVPDEANVILLLSWKRTDTSTMFGSFTFNANVNGNFEDIYDIAEGVRHSIGDYVGQTPKHLLYNSKYTSRTEGLSALTLLHFSDVHADSIAISTLARYAEEYTDFIDDVLNTGDTVKNTSENGIAYYVSSGLPAKALFCVGNHDTHTGSNYGNQKSYWTGLGQSGTYDMYMADYIGNWGVTQPDGVSDSSSPYYKACYYYKDYPTTKIRLICLDVMFTNATELAWFQQAMADTLDSSNSAYGYTVVVAAHYPPGVFEAEDVVRYNGEFTTFHDYGKVISSFQSWLSIEADYPSAVETFISNGGKFAAWISGHLHTNIFYYPSDYPDILCVGINQAGAGSEGYWANYMGADSELRTCANLVSIDTVNKLIKVLRLGRVSDLFLRSQKVIGYDYVNKKVVTNY